MFFLKKKIMFKIVFLEKGIGNQRGKEEKSSLVVKVDKLVKINFSFIIGLHITMISKC